MLLRHQPRTGDLFNSRGDREEKDKDKDGSSYYSPTECPARPNVLTLRWHLRNPPKKS